MKVLLLGGAGQLGSAIRTRWDDDVIAPSHAELDIEDTTALDAALERVAPDALVNCAAFHDVDRCESEPDRAFAVNALAVERAARRCRERGVRFATISTDYVFDGASTRPYAESDPPHPLSAYGASKYAGELLVERLESDAFVVRTCGVYGVNGARGKRTFIERLLAQAAAGEPIRVVRDVTVAPTYAAHLADALRALLAGGRPGLYHAVNAGAVTWYDYACEALRQAGVTARVEPISRHAWKAPARRPAYSALDCHALRRLGIGLPSWQAGIAAYLHDRG